MVLNRISFCILLTFVTLIGKTQTEIYFLNTNTGIENASGNGANRQVLVPASEVVPQGIAIDSENGFMYWTDWVSDKIQRAKLDGSLIEDLVISGLQLPEGIELDLQNGKMYWVDSGTKKIQRANLDGSEVEDLVIFDQVNLDAIAIDPQKGKMYWTEWGFDGRSRGNVRRANLDGTEIEELIDIRHGILKGIDLDLENGKVYWTDCSNANIQRANLDGSEMETILSELGTPNAMALDLINQKIYWTDLGKNKIQRANLDGSQVENVIDRDVEKLQDIALIVYCTQKSGNGCATVTSTSFETTRLIRIYPNPALEFITIDELQIGDHLLIYDSYGRVMVHKIARQKKMEVEVGHFLPGLYILVADGLQHRLSHTFVKGK